MRHDPYANYVTGPSLRKEVVPPPALHVKVQAKRVVCDLVQDCNKRWWLLQPKTVDIVDMMTKEQDMDKSKTSSLDFLLPSLRDIPMCTVTACVMAFGQEKCLFVAPPPANKIKKKKKTSPEGGRVTAEEVVVVREDLVSAQAYAKRAVENAGQVLNTKQRLPAEITQEKKSEKEIPTKITAEKEVKLRNAPDRSGCCIGRYCMNKNVQGEHLAGVRAMSLKLSKKVFWFVILADEEEREERVVSKSAPLSGRRSDQMLNSQDKEDRGLQEWKNEQMSSNRGRMPLSTMISVCDSCYAAYTAKAKERLQKQREDQWLTEEAKRAQDYLRYAEWQGKQEEALQQVLSNS